MHPPERPLSGNRVRRACRDFLRTGDARGLRDVVAQNRRELRTMAGVLCLLLTGCDPLP